MAAVGAGGNTRGIFRQHVISPHSACPVCLFHERNGRHRDSRRGAADPRVVAQGPRSSGACALSQTLIGFLLVFLLLFLGAPIAFGMAGVGLLGFAYFTGWSPALSMLGQIAYETTISDDLSVLPLFILMGSLINRAGLGRELYDCAYAFLGHRRGGLAMATVTACGGFGAVCGSSMATAATMAKVAMPSMRKYG